MKTLITRKKTKVITGDNVVIRTNKDGTIQSIRPRTGIYYRFENGKIQSMKYIFKKCDETEIDLNMLSDAELTEYRNGLEEFRKLKVVILGEND